MEKIKTYCFALQLEFNHLNRHAHLITYVRLIDGEEICELILLWVQFLANTTRESVFVIINTFLKNNNVLEEICRNLYWWCPESALAYES